MKGLRRVILESPYSAPTQAGIEANIDYARRCLHDCVTRGEAPIASHLLLTQPGVLADNDPTERALGIAAGHAWFAVAEACVVYIDRGISKGVLQGMEEAKRHNVPIEERNLPGYLDPAQTAPLFQEGSYWRAANGAVAKIIRIADGPHPWLTVRFVTGPNSESVEPFPMGLNPEGKWTHFGKSGWDLIEQLSDRDIPGAIR